MTQKRDFKPIDEKYGTCFNKPFASFIARDLFYWSIVEPEVVGNNVSINKSHYILTPLIQWAYAFYLNHINKKTKDVIKGTTLAVQYEWFVHNVAYYLGINQTRADPVEIGASIYSHQDIAVHVFLSLTYPIVVNAVIPHPINAIIFIIDLIATFL